ncbi:hypothetical protein GCM10023170_017170 [Phytohabitans houttuyneae]|uniref:Uncharacterized protein n=1 Tax=Phytohabitans houttuyneae TaxID=1076126 RepID=A0A6V8KKZ3_9ACTN|nr:hypothetical protein Phou_100320 [Phytohabitans houttuyneae]
MTEVVARCPDCGESVREVRAGETALANHGYMPDAPAYDPDQVVAYECLDDGMLAPAAVVWS